MRRFLWPAVWWLRQEVAILAYRAEAKGLFDPTHGNAYRWTAILFLLGGAAITLPPVGVLLFVDWISGSIDTQSTALSPIWSAAKLIGSVLWLIAMGTLILRTVIIGMTPWMRDMEGRSMLQELLEKRRRQLAWLERHWIGDDLTTHAQERSEAE